MAVPTGLVPLNIPFVLVVGRIYRLPGFAVEILGQFTTPTSLPGIVLIEVQSSNVTGNWAELKSGGITDQLFIRAGSSFGATIVCRAVSQTRDGSETSALFPIVWNQQVPGASLDTNQLVFANSDFGPNISYELLSIHYNYMVNATGACNLELHIIPYNALYTGGTHALVPTINLNDAARIHILSTTTLNFPRATRILGPDTSLVAVFNGSPAGLSGFGFTIWARAYPLGVRNP